MTTQIRRAAHLALVPCFDLSRRGCATAWLPVGEVHLADDGEGYMIELHTPIAGDETIYFRSLPEKRLPLFDRTNLER